jgi:leucyl/phenylalanyl-tRNA--protein transferase
MGGVFFGESMFSIEPDASKVALATYVDVLLRQNVALIDCQVYSAHLSSLGGRVG